MRVATMLTLDHVTRAIVTAVIATLGIARA
jgi:hypothetical protein